MATATRNSPAKHTKPRGHAGGNVPKGNQDFLFGKDNYTWMIAGFILIMIGSFLLAGGKSPDPAQFNRDEIYSFRRVTLAPVLIVLGFAIEAYAIMKKPKEKEEVK